MNKIMKSQHMSGAPSLRLFFILWMGMALLMAGGSCKKKSAETAAVSDVGVVSALQKTVAVMVEQVGQTRGSQEVEIRARVEGILESIHFEEGRPVAKGDLLYTIDPKLHQAQLAQAKGNFANAEAAWAKARQDVTRFQPLVERNAISRQQYDDALTAEQASAAAVDAAKAAVDAAEIQLGYTKLYAPIDGLAGRTEMKPGNLVGRGQTTLLTTISATDPIHVRFSVSEKDYLDYARANPDDAQRRAAARDCFELVLADGSLLPGRGSGIYADNYVDPATGTLMIEAAFPNPDKLVRPGQFARVRFPMFYITNAVLVPQRAITDLQATYSVRVVGADDTVEFRPVQAGPRIGMLQVVRSGLKPGERVIVEGLQKVQAGMTVNPKFVPVAEDETNAVPPAVR